jgi:demethylmenaquinone methyltransferase/2-methoxy-6-polyprenyl-1,4-benzoquinol methylase
VRKVAPQDRAPILDVCTGTGDLALGYWEVTAGQIPVVATDFCEEMLEIGRQKQRCAGIASNLEFLKADTTELPFDNDQFQLVTVAFGLRNVADPDRGLQEMCRVCRPGGRVAVLEFSLPTWAPLRWLYLAYFRHILPRIGQGLSRNRYEAYRYLPESVGQFPSGEQLADRMRAAGLRDVWFDPLTLGVATLYVGTKPANG